VSLEQKGGSLPGIRRGVCVSGVRREGVTRIKMGKCTWGKKGGSVSGLRRGECLWNKKGEVYLG